MSRLSLLIIDELGFVPLSPTGAELLFEVFSQRYERGSILVTTNLPFDEWTEVFGSERLTGALLDRLTHHVHILEMNGDSYRLKHNRENAASQAPDDTGDGYVAPETSSSCPVSYRPVCVTFPLNNCHGHCIFGCMGKAHDDLVAGVGQPVQGAIPQDGVVEEAEPLPHGPVAGDDETGDPVSADDQVPKPFLSDEGFKNLLEQCSSDTLAGSRRIASLMVLFTTGMRRRELWLLQTGDGDWKQGRINILHGKGGNTREVKLHPEARLALSVYLDLRRDLEFHDPALWVTEYGVPIGYAGLGRDMKRLAEKARLDLRDVFHIFRRTVARNAKRQNIDTQHILGESWMEG